MKKVYFVGQHNKEQLIELIKCIYKNNNSPYTLSVDGNNVIVKILDGNQEDNPMEHYIITNIDEAKGLNHHLLMDGQIITLGLNKKAVITASSIEGDDKEGFLRINYCLQREILMGHQAIEPGEFPVKISTELSHNVYHILSVITLLLLTKDKERKDKLVKKNTSKKSIRRI